MFFQMGRIRDKYKLNVTPHHFSGSRSEAIDRQISNNCPHKTICEGCASRYVSLCSVLNRNELDVFSKISADYKKEAKQIICSEDEAAEYMHNIRSGTVRLSKMLSDGRRQITGFLFAGDFFGLSCGDRYNYTAEAITDVEICRFPRVKVMQSFRDFPELGERAFNMTRTDLDASYDQMLLLGRKTAQEKLCSFLLIIRDKANRFRENDQNEVDISMSRTDIADYLGLTVETISRQFTKLQKTDLIKMEGAHKVFLKDIKALSALAIGD